MKVTIRNLQNKIPIRPRRITQAVLKTLSYEGVRKSGEITVSLVSDKQIKELNLKFLKRNRATDVLAFDISNSKRKILVADIVVSADAACRNAKIYKTSPLYEVYLYAVHATLHLLGYGDKADRQRKLMEKKAIRILSTLNI